MQTGEERGPAAPNTQSSVDPATAGKGRKMPPWLKPLTEFGPLGAFFIATYFYGGVLKATPVLMVTTVIALAATYAYERRLPLMPLVTCIAVVFFGGLTLIIGDPRFVMMKPTIVNMLFAVVLGAGLYFDKLFLRMLLGEALHLKAEGWRILTIRWICFFIFLAILNEIIWRNFSEVFWSGFKLWGNIPLTLLFTAFQVPLITKYQIADPKEGEADNRDKDQAER